MIKTMSQWYATERSHVNAGERGTINEGKTKKIIKIIHMPYILKEDRKNYMYYILKRTL